MHILTEFQRQHILNGNTAIRVLGLFPAAYPMKVCHCLREGVFIDTNFNTDTLIIHNPFINIYMMSY